MPHAVRLIPGTCVLHAVRFIPGTCALTCVADCHALGELIAEERERRERERERRRGKKRTQISLGLRHVWCCRVVGFIPGACADLCCCSYHFWNLCVRPRVAAGIYVERSKKVNTPWTEEELVVLKEIVQRDGPGERRALLPSFLPPSWI